MAPRQTSKTAAGSAIVLGLTFALALPRNASGQSRADAGGTSDGGISAPDAGPWGDPLYGQCPANDPAAPATQQADGSWLLPPLRAARQVCLLVTCDERRKQLEAAPPQLGTTSFVLAVVGMVMGLALGGYAGWAVARWLL